MLVLRFTQMQQQAMFSPTKTESSPVLEELLQVSSQTTPQEPHPLHHQQITLALACACALVNVKSHHLRILRYLSVICRR